MGLLAGGILRNGSDGRLTWWCPGCKTCHQVATGEGPRPRWGWNGSTDKPTFTPSVNVTSGHFVTHEDPATCSVCQHNREHPDESDGYCCGICHSFVIDGQMQFLGDCTHELAGQTVPIPPWPIPDWSDG